MTHEAGTFEEFDFHRLCPKRRSLFSGKTLLVAEDNQSLAHLFEKTLQGLGPKDVLVAGDGQDALYMAKEYEPDVVLLDLDLPVIDGWMVLTALRKEKVRTKVVINTGRYLSTEDVMRATRLGASNYIMQPADNSTWIGALLKTLTLGRYVGDPLEQRQRMTAIDQYKASSQGITVIGSKANLHFGPHIDNSVNVRSDGSSEMFDRLRMQVAQYFEEDRLKLQEVARKIEELEEEHEKSGGLSSKTYYEFIGVLGKSASAFSPMLDVLLKLLGSRG